MLISRRGLLHSCATLVWAFEIDRGCSALIVSPANAEENSTEIHRNGLVLGRSVKVRQNGAVFIVLLRKPQLIEILQAPLLTPKLADPNSERSQQPSFAKNWRRSTAPGVAVFSGVCTRCACVVETISEVQSSEPARGFICRCCGSTFDWAGRAFLGPARTNLAVPPYSLKNGRITILRHTSLLLAPSIDIRRTS